MAAASILPHSPRGTTEGLLSFDAAAVADTATPSFEGFAKDFQDEVKHISQQFCRVELALRRSCAPVSEAWATFLQFATEHNHVEEGLVCLYMCDWLVEDMRAHLHDREMQRTGCRVIALCGKMSADGRDMMASRGLMAAAVSAMNSHPACPAVHVAALQAVLALCTDERNVRRAWECKVLSSVGRVLEADGVPEVQRLGRQLLALFTEQQQQQQQEGAKSGACSVGSTGLKDAGYGMVQRKRRRSEECCVSSNEGNGKRAGESETQTESTEDDDDCSQNNNNNCIICMQERRTHAFLPCGHLCVCRTCADAVQSHSCRNSMMNGGQRRACCPICRTPSQAVMRIFTS